MKIFTDDRIEAMHDTALEVLENLGIKVLLPEARKHFKLAGAKVDEDEEMVYIGRELVDAAVGRGRLPRQVSHAREVVARTEIEL